MGVNNFDNECTPPLKGYITLPPHTILTNNGTNSKKHSGGLAGRREVGERSSTNISYHISKGTVNCRNNTLGYVTPKGTGVHLRSGMIEKMSKIPSGCTTVGYLCITVTTGDIKASHGS